MIDTQINGPVWTTAHKIFFRFFFLYFCLSIAPWTWLGDIPYTGKIAELYYLLIDGLVNAGNRYLFHIKEQLVPVNGSGDTSYAWAQLCLTLFVAALGCMAWSVADRKSRNYIKADYWLRILVRYFIAMIALNYGIQKLFTEQMPFPNHSQLLTPLGDFLPMRLLWLTLGYSTSYQVFSGVLEVLAGILLLYRKTVTLGACLAVGIFFNVVMLNLCYDVPVKTCSINLLFASLFLLSYDFNRIASFFILNRPAPASKIYDSMLPKRWMRMGRITIKLLFMYVVMVVPFADGYGINNTTITAKGLNPGIYNVAIFTVNDTLHPLAGDKRYWTDMVFEKDGTGSVNSAESMFRQRYGRGYFNYETNTVKHIIAFKKLPEDDSAMFTVYYRLKDSKTVQFWTKINNDSLYILLTLNDSKLPLEQQQFHWLSEGNR